jgi:hypothetical protein
MAAGNLLDLQNAIGIRPALTVFPFLDGVGCAIADAPSQGLVVKLLPPHVVQEFHNPKCSPFWGTLSSPEMGRDGIPTLLHYPHYGE